MGQSSRRIAFQRAFKETMITSNGDRINKSPQNETKYILIIAPITKSKNKTNKKKK